jgi:hypothetical protein
MLLSTTQDPWLWRLDSNGLMSSKAVMYDGAMAET